MNATNILSVCLMLIGCGFYFAGTIGLLRFPDVFCRLHALTKADNLGLLLVCAGLALYSRDAQVASILGLIWLVGLLAATVSAHLIARHARRAGHPAAGQQENR